MILHTIACIKLYLIVSLAEQIRIQYLSKQRMQPIQVTPGMKNGVYDAQRERERHIVRETKIELN